MMRITRVLQKTRAVQYQTLTRTFATGKEIDFSDSARSRILSGVHKLANAVQVTLGPKGRNVAIEQSYGPPKITKDGVTVAKAIDFTDKYENLGAQLVKSVAQKTNDLAGDGTTTATVLARVLFQEGCKSVAAGMNPMDLRRGMNHAVDRVVANLNSKKTTISTKEEIMQVATISANGETAIGRLIADAMEKVGRDGVITVQDGKALVDQLEVVEGMKFDRGYVSPYFVTNPKNMKCEFENCKILLYDGKISSIQSIMQITEEVLKAGMPFCIVAEDIEGEALAFLVLNKVRGFAKVCAVKAPGFGDNRKQSLQDLAVVTGGEVISDELGGKLENVTVEQLGTAKKVSISKDDTLLLDGGGAKTDVEARCVSIRDAMAVQGISDYEKEKLAERLAKLSGGVAVIKVGGASEVEVGEKKDRVEDALNATRAAVDEGIVPGGGTALLYSTLVLKDIKLENYDQNMGVDIVRRALAVPARAILDNAGLEGAVLVGKLLEEAKGDSGARRGYDAQTGAAVDMIKVGIIDPTKVVRTALVDAAGVASLMTTTEAVIVEAAKREGAAVPPPSQMPQGGYRDMF